MDDLFKVESIKEKGLGCIALKEIKKGALILQGESTQIVHFKM